MNLRTTILLLLVLAALGAAAWFLRPTGEVDPWAKPTEQLTESQHPTLLQTLGVDANRITKIMLAPSTRAPLTLARSGDHWLIQEPVVWKADTNAVEALILEPIRQTVVLETRALEPYAAAADTLELTDDAGHSTSITLGQDLGAGSGLLYADKTYRTNNRLRALMGDLRSSSALTALVDPQIDFPPLARLSALTVDSGNSHTRVVRGKQGFTLDQPGAPRADAAAVAAYGAELSKLRLAEIPQETASDAQRGFDKSPVKVTLEETGGARTTLEVGGPTGPDLKRYFIRLTPPSGAPLVGAVETAQIQALPQGANFFRDWRIFLTKPADLRRLRVEQEGSAAIDIALGSDDPQAKAAMDALTALTPTGVAPAIAKPTHRLVLTDAFGREEVFSLAIGPDACAIQRTGDAEGFAVPKAQVERLLGGTEGLRDRNLAGFGDEAITEIHLEQHVYALKFDFVKKNGKWTTADGSSFEAAAVEELEKALKAPRAGGFMTRDPATYMRPAIRMTAKGPHKNLSITCADTKDPDASKWDEFQGADGKAQRLHLSPSLQSLLRSEFLPRQLLALPPEKIAWIEIAHHGGPPTLRITKEASGAYSAVVTGAEKPEDDRSDKLTQADCAALFDALGNLRVEQPEPIALAWSGAHGHVIVIHETGGKEHQLELWNRHTFFGPHSDTEQFTMHIQRAFHWHGRQDETMKAIFGKLGWFYLASDDDDKPQAIPPQ